MTNGAVTTRVVGVAVPVGAGASNVLRRTAASVAIHQVVACAVVETWITGTFVYVRLTALT